MVTNLRMGFDIGGTFTDLIVVNEETGELHIGKVLTTPAELAVGVEKGVAELLRSAGIPGYAINKPVHGATTLVTNAIIERKGAKTALITTRGFGDTLEIAREWRYDIYDLFLKLPEPLVPRHLRKEIAERTRADGVVLERLDRHEALRIVGELDGEGITAYAVVFLHSYRNPQNERAMGEIVKGALPNAYLTLSSDLVPEIREYERTSTTVANAYVLPLIGKHLLRIIGCLKKLEITGDLFLMQSNGGIIGLEIAERFPIRLLESGPAAGAIGAAIFGKIIGKRELISFDMGGTTAKISLIEGGKPTVVNEMETARVDRFKKGSGLPIRVPVIDMIEIGAGGGSIARISDIGLMKVGPESAGADPGPCCYSRRGWMPTVTDADLLMGLLDPKFFLGGKMELSPERAEKAIEEQLARPLKISVMEAAAGVYEIVNENMTNALKIHLAEKGKDPREYSMVAFGGAGPMHATEIARRLGIKQVIVPLAAGALSALGLLMAPGVVDFVRTLITKVDEIPFDEVNHIFRDMEERATEILEKIGGKGFQVSFQKIGDMRYVGQGFEIDVLLPDKIDETTIELIKDRFYEAYKETYGRSVTDVPVEVINWRLVATTSPLFEKLAPALQVPDQSPVKGTRNIYVPSHRGEQPATVYDHYLLKPGSVISGPAVIEQKECTTVLWPWDKAVVEDYQSLYITVGEM